MSDGTKIEWADYTFNPWIGCTKVGPGCDHCYAEMLATARLGMAWGVGADRRRTVPSNWAKPRSWDRKAAAAGTRYRVFCSSLADVFDNAAPAGARADLAALILATPNLDWLLLTKRIGNAAGMLKAMFPGGTPDHVWLGATIVNQAEADRDIPKLLATDAAVRFLSMEPLLGPVDLNSNLGGTLWMGGQRGCAGSRERSGAMHHGIGTPDCPRHLHHHHDDRCRPGLSWVIVGGESGPGARPMHPDWVRSIRDQCAAAGVPFFFKQVGEWSAVLDRDRDDPDWRADYSNDLAENGKTRWLNLAVGRGFHGERFHVLPRVGKKASGRLLDGVEHSAMPEGR